MNLVTLRRVKAHLSQDTSYDDRMLEEKRLEASALVLDYLKVDTSDTSFDWVDEFGEPTKNIPPVVTAAVLITVGALYENRDGTEHERAPQVLSQSVVDMLMRSRDPALA